MAGYNYLLKHSS